MENDKKNALSPIAEKVTSFDSLYDGLKKSCKNVRWKDSVVGYESRGLRATYKLQEALRSGDYQIQGYQRFRIFEPKERRIVATRIRDRQFQHSLVDNYVYPQVTKSFIRDNHACQKGRGVDDCLNRMTRHLRKYYQKYGCEGWVLKCDIHHYFESIPHDKAKEAFDKLLQDEWCKQKVFDIIDSFNQDGTETGVDSSYSDGKSEYDDFRGLGLGSQISQLCGLVLLNDLDHYIKEVLHIEAYSRYMDDLILVDHDKEHLRYCRDEIERKLHDLGLTLNKKTGLFPLKNGVIILKWRFVLTKSGAVKRIMNREKITHQKKKVTKILDRESHGMCEPGTADASMQSWMANAKRGDSFSERREMARIYCELSGGKRYHDYIKSGTKDSTSGSNSKTV